MKKILPCCIALSLLFQYSLGQSNLKNNFANVDNYVKKLGSLTSLNVSVIADTLTRNFSEKEDKARAIFFWIATNIALDGKAIKQNDHGKSLPENVVQFRKSTPLGFSLLVQEMCSQANIRCLSVDGYVKSRAEEINEKADEFNHSWNVVQLGKSPEEWYYLDAARASGFLDNKMSVFTPSFTSEYFFADKNLFNLDHYPDNNAWQLGPSGPKSIKDFYSLPVFLTGAYTFGLGKPKPATGLIKTSVKKPVSFNFPFNGTVIKSIELIIGDGRKQRKPEAMNFSTYAGIVSFNYQFKIPDEFPATIRINGKDVLAYNILVTE